MIFTLINQNIYFFKKIL